MTQLNEAVREFGEKMGLKGLDVPEKGSRALNFEKKGILSFERKPGGVLINLIRQHPQLYENTYQKALSLSHSGIHSIFNVTAATKGDNILIFSAFIEEYDISYQNIHMVFDHLINLHQQVMA
ncbi:MAG: hypothetical protein KBE16_03310 [Alphaproteobacteria bacterium]|nr:hypothetical protein [Alphaproteobacteria bacterium]MBP9877065.1 hypothetical protein [Alphaproteobacteria bacterium]